MGRSPNLSNPIPCPLFILDVYLASLIINANTNNTNDITNDNTCNKQLAIHTLRHRNRRNGPNNNKNAETDQFKLNIINKLILCNNINNIFHIFNKEML